MDVMIELKGTRNHCEKLQKKLISTQQQGK